MAFVLLPLQGHAEYIVVNMIGAQLIAIPSLTFLHDQNAFACLEFPSDASFQYDQLPINIAQNSSGTFVYFLPSLFKTRMGEEQPPSSSWLQCLIGS